jgi:hypothetical protein
MDMKLILRVFWDRVGAWLLIGLGALCLLLGWLGASGTPYVEAQIPYVISGGLVGLGLIGLGATLWLSSDLRDEWHRLLALEEAVRSLIETDSLADPSTELPAVTSSANGKSPRRAGRVAGAEDVTTPTVAE